MTTIKVKKMNSWKGKICGNIGKKEIESIYFETRWGIHTFGLRKPIDVVILDTHNQIRVLKQNLKPNRIFFWNPRYYQIIELPKGYILKNGIKVGRKITLTFTATQLVEYHNT